MIKRTLTAAVTLAALTFGAAIAQAENPMVGGGGDVSRKRTSSRTPSIPRITRRSSPR